MAKTVTARAADAPSAVSETPSAVSDTDLLALANEVLPASIRISGISVQEITIDEGVRSVVFFSSYSWLTYKVAAPDELAEDPAAFKSELRNRILG